jgi:hypothetical protein
VLVDEANVANGTPFVSIDRAAPKVFALKISADVAPDVAPESGSADANSKASASNACLRAHRFPIRSACHGDSSPGDRNDALRPTIVCGGRRVCGLEASLTAFAARPDYVLRQIGNVNNNQSRLCPGNRDR